MSDNVIWKDTGWKQVLETSSALGRLTVKVGVVGEAAREAHGDSDLTNAEIAAINEYGSDDGHVPERDFIRRTFRSHQGEVANTLAAAVRRAIFANTGAHVALDRAGEWGADQIRRTIDEGVPPPNAPSTVAKKGSAKPLVDDGELYKAIGHTVTATREPQQYEELEIAGMTQEGFE